MRILDRYLTKKIGITIFLTLVSLTTFSLIIRLTEEIPRVGQGNYSISDAIIYSVAKAFPDLSIFFPMAGLLGAMIALGQLASHYELIIIQAVGISRVRILLGFLWFIIPFASANLALQQWVTPKVTAYALQMKAEKISNGGIYTNSQSLWAKAPGEFIYAQIKDKIISQVFIIKFNTENTKEAQRLIFGNEATWDANKEQWVISKATIYESTTPQELTSLELEQIKQHLQQAPQANLDFVQQALSKFNYSSQYNIKIYKNFTWKTSLTPKKLVLVNEDTDNFSLTSLWSYIKYLESTEQNANEYKYLFWSKVFSFISFFIMLFVATSSIFGSMRSASMLLKIFLAVILGLAFHILNSTVGPFLPNLGVPAVLAALIPSAIFFVLGLYLFNRRQ